MHYTADTLARTDVASPGSPDSSEDGAPAFRPRKDGTGESRPRKILVVDDDPAIRRLVVEVVSKAGFNADMARDGEEGWKALCLTTYDLVITDNAMPGLSGIRMIKRLREVSVEPPCILMSGYMQASDSALMEVVHPGTVLAKPFLPSALIEMVYGLLLRGDPGEL